MTVLENGINENGVRNERQLRTQRKIKVNAQITFVLWVMETLVNTALVISVLVGGLGQVTFTLNMILFMIILPYSYLNNTSHNKSRIAEEGWLNVLKNISPCSGKNGRSNLTRVYAISYGPLVCNGDNNHVIVINKTIHNKSHLQTTNNPELHVPTEEEQGDAAGTTEQDQSQTEQVALSGMKLVTPYSSLSSCQEIG